jgi:hypothetical protein
LQPGLETALSGLARLLISMAAARHSPLETLPPGTEYSDAETEG